MAFPREGILLALPLAKILHLSMLLLLPLPLPCLLLGSQALLLRGLFFYRLYSRRPRLITISLFPQKTFPEPSEEALVSIESSSVCE